jgi:AcrR family transcriptional regulator
VTEGTLKAGRPRDPHVDEALHRAAVDVFMERGYQRASLSEVARRAGVGTPAIYRRWRTKAEVAIEIIERAALPDPIPDSGSIRDDLVSFLKARLRLWASPLFHHVLLPLAMEASTDKRIAEQFRKHFAEYREPGVLNRLNRAIEAGQLRPDTVSARLLEQLQGSIAIPLLFSQDLPAESEAALIVDRVLDGYAARPS